MDPAPGCLEDTSQLLFEYVRSSSAVAVLDLVSAFTSTFTVFILPCLFYLKLRGGPWSSPPRYINPLEIAWNGLILIFSIVGATFGTVGAIQELISLAHPADPAAGNTTAMA